MPRFVPSALLAMRDLLLELLRLVLTCVELILCSRNLGDRPVVLLLEFGEPPFESLALLKRC